MVLEKDGQDQLDRSYEKLRSITKCQGKKGISSVQEKLRKTNCIDHRLRRNSRVKRVIEEKIQEAEGR